MTLWVSIVFYRLNVDLPKGGKLFLYMRWKFYFKIVILRVLAGFPVQELNIIYFRGSTEEVIPIFVWFASVYFYLFQLFNETSVFAYWRR